MILAVSFTDILNKASRIKVLTYEENDAVNHYQQRLAEAFEAFLTGARILDVGCGDGEWVIRYFSPRGKYVVGIDVKRPKNFVSKVSNIDFLIGDACHLPFSDGTFDIVFEKDILHHMNDPIRGLKEMSRVASKTVILVEANRYNPIGYFHMVKAQGHQHLTQHQFKDIVSAVSFAGKKFMTREAHFYPMRSKVLLYFLKQFQNLVERISLAKSLHSYNIAVCEKETGSR